MKCTGKEWDTCRVEKMGCRGCYYDEKKFIEFTKDQEGVNVYCIKEDITVGDVLMGVAATIKCKCAVTIGEGQVGWGAEPNINYYILKILKIVEVKNYEIPIK